MKVPVHLVASCGVCWFIISCALAIGLGIPLGLMNSCSMSPSPLQSPPPPPPSRPTQNIVFDETQNMNRVVIPGVTASLFLRQDVPYCNRTITPFDLDAFVCVATIDKCYHLLPSSTPLTQNEHPICAEHASTGIPLPSWRWNGDSQAKNTTIIISNPFPIPLNIQHGLNDCDNPHSKDWSFGMFDLPLPAVKVCSYENRKCISVRLYTTFQNSTYRMCHHPDRHGLFR